MISLYSTNMNININSVGHTTKIQQHMSTKSEGDISAVTGPLSSSLTPLQLPWSQIKKSMPSMGSQYLIKQHLHTQPGGRDVHVTVHSTDWHTSHSLITCGDAVHIRSQLGQQAGATASATPPTDPVTHPVIFLKKLGFKKVKNLNSKAFRHKPV